MDIESDTVVRSTRIDGVKEHTSVLQTGTGTGTGTGTDLPDGVLQGPA